MHPSEQFLQVNCWFRFAIKLLCCFFCVFCLVKNGRFIYIRVTDVMKPAKSISIGCGFPVQNPSAADADLSRDQN